MKSFKLFQKLHYSIKSKFPIKSSNKKYIFAGLALSTFAYMANDNIFNLRNYVPEKFYLGNQEYMENEGKFSKTFYFQSGGAMIADDKKKEKGGEDAYFATRVAIGVADGVGG